MKIYEAILNDEIEAPVGEIVDVTVRTDGRNQTKLIACILTDDIDALVTRRFQIGQERTSLPNSQFLKVIQFNQKWRYVWELSVEPVVDVVEDILNMGADALANSEAAHIERFHTADVIMEIKHEGPSEAVLEDMVREQEENHEESN